MDDAQIVVVEYEEKKTQHTELFPHYVQDFASVGAAHAAVYMSGEMLVRKIWQLHYVE